MSIFDKISRTNKTLDDVTEQERVLEKVRNQHNKLTIADVRKLAKHNYEEKIKVNIGEGREVQWFGSPADILRILNDAKKKGKKIHTIRFFEPWQYNSLTRPSTDEQSLLDLVKSFNNDEEDN